MSNCYILSVGCNYRGTSYELPDCELDSDNIVEAFGQYVASAKTLQRTEVNPFTIRVAVSEIAKKLKRGDAAICYYSGHGTTQRVGKKLIQGIVMDDGSVLWEQELRKILAAITPAIFIADSCFSGGLARGGKKHQTRRFVPFSKLRDAKSPVIVGRQAKRQYDYFSACSGSETAASTGDGGAFTNAALGVLRDAKPTITMRGIYTAVRKMLPNAEYQQTPQFVASDAGFANRTLASFMGAK